MSGTRSTVSAHCNERHYEQMEKETSENREKRLTKTCVTWKKRYEERKTQGLYVRCGKPAYKGGVFCYECKISEKKRDKLRWKKKQLAKPPKPEGICHFCDKPVKEGFKVCEEHYKELSNRIAEARKKIDYKNHIWRNLK